VNKSYLHDIYRIMPVVKVKTDIFTIIVATFTTNFIISICSVIMCLMSH